MQELSLGIIETIGLAAAFEAADVCLKSADVTLIGYELSKGDGMATVKIRGNVGAVKAAIEAAKISAGRINKVVSAHVIPRPSKDIDFLIRNRDTVGLEKPEKSELTDYGEESFIEEKQEEQEKPETQEINAVNIESDSAGLPVFLPEEVEESGQTEESGENGENEETEETGENEETEEIRETEEAEETAADQIELDSEVAASENTEEVNEEPTCNLCGDPSCPRKKGELRSLCIHYKKINI